MYYGPYRVLKVDPPNVSVVRCDKPHAKVQEVHINCLKFWPGRRNDSCYPTSDLSGDDKVPDSVNEDCDL